MLTKKEDAILIDNKGCVIFEKKDFETPVEWSSSASLIVASKYATADEISVFQVVDRMVNKIGQWSLNQGYQSSEQELAQFKAELRSLFLEQKAALNTPSWTNLGVDNVKQQPHACYLGHIEDTMDSILKHVETAGNIFKGGSGIGVNVSALRAEGEPLSNRGHSSGVLSFMRMWDKSAGVIRSGGRNRRSAVLIGMEADHPDIQKFIHCKSVEEGKAKTLIAAGYKPEEAYATVDYQNANHSVLVTDKFMQAVEKNLDWNLVNRTDKAVVKTLKARDLFNELCEQAHLTGDPGLQFVDTINKFNPIPSSGRIEISNPCSEIFGIPYTSCHLCCINLKKYFDSSSLEIDRDLLEKDIKTLITAMDAMLDEADYATEDFRRVAISTRPLGLGITNLGAILMLKGLPYGDPPSVVYTEDLLRFITYCATKASLGLAKKLGKFEKYEEATMKVFKQVLKEYWTKDLEEDFKKYGIRNSQLTTAMPSGTVSLVMDADSFSIEPLFALKMYKNLSGGGVLEIEPPCVELAKKKYGNSIPHLFDTANDIPWKAHIDITTATQSAISSGVSKTINMANSATVKDVYDAYMYAWKKGLKGITIYRDGSKGMQPLTDANKAEKAPEKALAEPISAIPDQDTLPPSFRLKLPPTRKALVHKVDIAGHEAYVTAGMYDNGALGELFISMSKEGSMVSGIMDAFATMVSLGIQYGVPLTKIIDKLKNTKFDPCGITANSEIPMASSLMDYLAKWLEQNFVELEDEDWDEESTLEDFEEESEEKAVKDLSVGLKTLNSTMKSTAKYSGEICTNCGGMMVKAGTCSTCLVCGGTSGCS